MKCPILFVMLLLTVCNTYWKKTVVDLSHQHKPNMTAYPVYPSLNFTIMARGRDPDIADGKLWLEFNRFEMVEHYSTHVDVPSHMAEGQRRLHEIPVGQFFGPAVVIDISERAKTNPDAQVMVSDLQAWEKKYGEIPDGAMVLMRSGWDKKFSNISDYFGTADPLNTTSFHYPGFSDESAKWLVENRPTFHGVGVDTISLDYGPSLYFEAHVILFDENKIGYENLANLELLPESGAMFYAAPMNLYDGSGCPVRAFAILDDEASNGSSQKIAPLLFAMCICVGVYEFITKLM